jgi:hypothetical protein
MREHERGRREEFWHNRLAMRGDDKMRRRASIYRKGGGGSPLGWAPSVTHPKGEGPIKERKWEDEG